MTTTINVGLRVGANGRTMPKDRALRALRAAGVEVLRYRVVPGNEPTLVATVRHAPDRKLAAAARMLRQWAIARCAGGHDALVGPRAGEWGAFDGALFIAA